MKKIAAVVGLLVAAVAAVAVLQPSGAGAVDPPASADTVTVTGEGTVLAVPDRAEISAGVETRAQTARAALQANATAARLAEKAADVPGVKITRPVEANAVFAILPPGVTEPLQAQYPFYVWDETTGEVRWMTSFATTDQDVDDFVAALARLVG